jgi:hypothetical protein
MFSARVRRNETENHFGMNRVYRNKTESRFSINNRSFLKKPSHLSTLQIPFWILLLESRVNVGENNIFYFGSIMYVMPAQKLYYMSKIFLKKVIWHTKSNLTKMACIVLKPSEIKEVLDQEKYIQMSPQRLYPPAGWL